MLISLDTETTGVDFSHGAKPFLVTTCDDEGVIRYWEWNVDPETRQPYIHDEDRLEIAEIIDSADLIYLQNSKFDAHALDTIGLSLPWSKVRDTYIAGHLLASNHPHNLTDMCIEYLGRDISKYEDQVKSVVQACRQIVKKQFPHWMIAKEDQEGMPSVKGSSKRDEDKPWKNDMWLPRALAVAHGVSNPNYNGPEIEWLDACSQYANTDSEYTLALGLTMERLINERSLWNIYLHRLEVMRTDYEIECAGLTVIGEYTEKNIEEYQNFIDQSACVLRDIAAKYGHELELAEGASLNDNMRDFFYGAEKKVCPHCGYNRRIKHWNDSPYKGVETSCPKCAKSTRRWRGTTVVLNTVRRDNLNLPVIESSKTGNASLDKDALKEYMVTAEGDAREFIKTLIIRRQHGKDLADMETYRRFWKPIRGQDGYYKIKPNLNPCGSDHLRQSSSNPNLQNVSTQDIGCSACEGDGCEICNNTGKSRLSTRRCFGPAPGREWWDLDFRNIEKRIPAYEAEEEKLIEIFEKPDEPPYWGSDHLLIASLLFPDEFWPIADEDGKFKEIYLQKYKKCKNTNFAQQYLAGDAKLELTSGVKGTGEKIRRGLPKMAKLQDKYLRMAEKTGYVTTLPDRTVDPERGYPILASRTSDGRVLSTTPFSYHVSGTACWMKNTAMIRCADRCKELRREGFDAYLILEVHDSLLFDCPQGNKPEANLWFAEEMKVLMEQSGNDAVPQIPTPVLISYHRENWADETPFEKK